MKWSGNLVKWILIGLLLVFQFNTKVIGLNSKVPFTGLSQNLKVREKGISINMRVDSVAKSKPLSGNISSKALVYKKYWSPQDFIDNPLVKKLIEYLILYFLISIVILLGIIYFHSFRSQIRNYKKVKLRNQIQNLLSVYLVDENQEQAIRELKKIQKKAQRQLLINEIEVLLANLSGEISEQLKELYLLLNLQKDSVDKLHQRDWETVITGIKELERFRIREKAGAIKKLLNSHHEEVRVEAHYAYLVMSEDDPWFFLDQIENSLTHWEQLNLHYLVKMNTLQVPEFSRWLNSPYPSVVLFCLKMIALNGQLDAASQVLPLLDHENEEIRRSAIETLSSLYFLPASSAFRRIYSQETKKNKRAILKAMQNIQDEDNFDFLDKLFIQEEDFEVLLLTAQALYLLNGKGSDAMTKYLGISDEKKAIIKHVLDERIM